MLSQTVAFDSTNPAPAFAALPEAVGIFALFGDDPKAEPYLARTTSLRRRLRRFLDAKPTQSRRLRLAERVTRIEYTLTGSDFESALVLYAATLEAFGQRARKRLHLAAPNLLRLTTRNRYPRLYATNTISRSAADCLYGPFASRASAERFCDETLNLFQLRRCYPDLDPDPAFPGCVYSEMKMCLAPCFQGCSDERYAAEAAQVEAFLASRGRSLIQALAEDRDQASVNLDFEKAASLHARIQRVEAVAALASEAVRPIARLRAIIIQPSAEAGHVALFELHAGQLNGPVLFNTLGMRLHNEQSGSSSLYTHPFALEPVPLLDPSAPITPTAQDTLSSRLDQSLLELNSNLNARGDNQSLADSLSLFARWYYRPETKRVGEVVFLEPHEQPPAKSLLRSISRVFRGSLDASNAAVPSVELSE